MYWWNICLYISQKRPKKNSKLNICKPATKFLKYEEIVDASILNIKIIDKKNAECVKSTPILTIFLCVFEII